LKGFSSLTLILLASSTAVGSGISQLSGHVPLKQVARAQELGRKSSGDRIELAFVLNPSDPADLAATIQSLYTPSDPLYHQFLTPTQFTARFGPSEQDINKISQYLTARGIDVTHVHSNRLVVDAEGSVSNIENAFQIELHEYLAEDGRIVYAPSSDPLVSDEVSSNLNAIVGLNNFSLKKPHFVKNSKPLDEHPNASVSSYMTPSRIKSIYGLSSLSQTGAGETLALFELDGYTSSDIAAYESYFLLPSTTLTNVLVDGVSGTPSTSDGPSEVTLDIELAVGMAPGLSKILVYEGPNTDSGLIDTYSRIATDNLANEVSSSWGEAENEMSAGTMNSENTIFQEMATQGQSVYAAAGDA
jgi:subtilase family serine protease